MKELLNNLSNFFWMRCRVKKFGRALNFNECRLALQIDCLQYLTTDIDKEETNILYNSLIQSRFFVLEESNLDILKALLTRIRNNETINNQLSEAEYWYIDLNLISQLSFDLDDLKKNIAELLNIFADKKIVLIIDSIHLYFNNTKGFDRADSFQKLINYNYKFVSTLMEKENIYIIGIHNR